jgi:hypothetical protein
MRPIRHLITLIRRLTDPTITRSKHWPSDGIVRRAAVAIGVGLAIAGLFAGQALIVVAKMVWG